MKVLIVSDTHGWLGNLETVLEKVKPVDYIVHCGDVERDEDYISVVAGCPVHIVAGNNDWGSALDREIVTMMGKYRVMITHGHHYSVNYGMDGLIKGAQARQADIVMYGHTHIPALERVGDTVFLNPGSLTLPRQYGRVPTYAMMNIDDGGTAHFSIIQLEREGVKMLQTLDFTGKDGN